MSISANVFGVAEVAEDDLDEAYRNQQPCVSRPEGQGSEVTTESALPSLIGEPVDINVDALVTLLCHWHQQFVFVAHDDPV